MKIVAGLGSVDEYIRYCEAGADEFFCGYVPYKWTKKYGTMMALNRREVLCCNVQIGGEEELEILASMIHVYQKPVHLTFNSLYYLPEQYPLIGQIISNCLEMGFRSYIIADPALILYLHEQGITGRDEQQCGGDFCGNESEAYHFPPEEQYCRYAGGNRSRGTKSV